MSLFAFWLSLSKEKCVNRVVTFTTKQDIYCYRWCVRLVNRSIWIACTSRAFCFVNPFTCLLLSYSLCTINKAHFSFYCFTYSALFRSQQPCTSWIRSLPAWVVKVWLFYLMWIIFIIPFLMVVQMFNLCQSYSCVVHMNLKRSEWCIFHKNVFYYSCRDVYVCLEQFPGNVSVVVYVFWQHTEKLNVQTKLFKPNRMQK